MAKTKTPFLSLGARGTIADAITTQKRPRTTMVRTKPIPTDRYTLPQAYQRWLYEDYCYLWTKQSDSVKASYKALAARKHSTPLAQWLSQKLANLPDIAYMLHLDSITNSLVIDFSKNANHATVFGASLTPGLIDHALYFDGLNDFTKSPHQPSLNFPKAMTVEAFVTPLEPADLAFIITKSNAIGTLRPHELWFHKLTRTFRFAVYDGSWKIVTCPTPIQYGTPHHVAGIWDGAFIYIYVDHLPTKGPALSAMPTNTDTLDIGTTHHWLSNWFKGTIDHLIVYNRVLDAAEIKRHSERRYPPQ